MEREGEREECRERKGRGGDEEVNRADICHAISPQGKKYM